MDWKFWAQRQPEKTQSIETDTAPSMSYESAEDAKKKHGNRYRYETNGILQRIVKSPAKDMTREWFDISIDGNTENEVSKAILKRLNQLDMKNKVMNIIVIIIIYSTNI